MERDGFRLLLYHQHTTRLSDPCTVAARAIGQFCDHPLVPDLANAPARWGAPAGCLVPDAAAAEADFMTWCDVTWRWWAAVVRDEDIIILRRSTTTSRTSIEPLLNLDLDNYIAADTLLAQVFQEFFF